MKLVEKAAAASRISAPQARRSGHRKQIGTDARPSRLAAGDGRDAELRPDQIRQRTHPGNRRFSKQSRRMTSMRSPGTQRCATSPLGAKNPAEVILRANEPAEAIFMIVAGKVRRSFETSEAFLKSGSPGDDHVLIRAQRRCSHRLP